MKRNQLNYSALTDKIYWVDNKGSKEDVTDNFDQIIKIRETTKKMVGGCEHKWEFVGTVNAEYCIKCKQWRDA